MKRGSDLAAEKSGLARSESGDRTQDATERAAQQTARRMGGGKVHIQGRDGKLLDSDTVRRDITRFRRMVRNT